MDAKEKIKTKSPLSQEYKPSSYELVFYQEERDFDTDSFLTRLQEFLDKQNLEFNSLGDIDFRNSNVLFTVKTERVVLDGPAEEGRLHVRLKFNLEKRDPRHEMNLKYDTGYGQGNIQLDFLEFLNAFLKKDSRDYRMEYYIEPND